MFHRLASILVLASAALGQAQPDASADSAGSCAIAVVGDALLAVGPTYAARIDGAGIEMRSSASAAADPEISLRLELDSISRGDRIFLRDAPPAIAEREGLTVRLPRGAGVVERFEVGEAGIEHSYVFSRRPEGSGDLVVRLRATSPLSPRSGIEDLRFECADRGAFTIGGVTGIDADGRRARGTLRHERGHVEYRLPAEFVDAARFPLLLDPVLGAAFTLLPNGSSSVSAPDVAYDERFGVYLVVWARGSSAGSSQIEGQLVSAAGALVGGLLTIHPAAAGEIVADPAVANVNGANRFVIVYERTPSGGTVEVRARTINASNGTVSAASTLVSSQGAIGAANPDVGGRGATGGLTALIAWETVSNHQIHARLVTVPSGAIVQPPNLIGSEVVVADFPAAIESNPAVSRHGGVAGNYLVVWERNITGVRLIGGRVVGNGNATGATLLTPIANLTGAVAPDELDPDCAAADDRRYLVIYEQLGLPGIACKAATFDPAAGTLSVGTEQPLAVAALTPGLVSNSAFDPSVDFADLRYLVTYATSSVGTSAPSAPSLRSTSVRLQEIGIDACVLDSTTESLATAVLSTSVSGTSGSSVDAPCVGAVFSGSEAGQNDEGLAVWVTSNSTSSGIPPVVSTSRGLAARRVEAIGQGGAVTILAPGCGGAGVAGVAGPAVIGNPRFAFTLTGAPLAFPGLIFNLNVPQPSFGCGACQVLPYGISIPLQATNGAARLSIPLPCDPALVNAAVAVQWTVLGPNACAFLPQLVWSEILGVTIGA